MFRSLLSAILVLSSIGSVGAQTPDPVVLCAPPTNAVGWTLTTDASPALATADRGWAAADLPLASPTLYFEHTFNADAGAYRIWIRMRALNNSKFNDAVWVQFSDAVNSTGGALYPIGSTKGLLVNLATDALAGSLRDWGWQNGAYWLSQTTTARFTKSGTHTIRVQVREDGVVVDQIVLSARTYATRSPGTVTSDVTRLPCTGPQPPAPTPPEAVHSGTPADNGTDVSATTALTWTASNGATAYDVAFGNANPPPLVSTNQSGVSYQPTSALAAGTTYYWQVTATGPGGATAGPVWKFSTAPAIEPPPPPPPPPPSVPALIAPIDAALEVPVDVTLSWGTSAGATAYDVSLGLTNPPPLVSPAQTGTAFRPAATLSSATTYYWQVTARGDGGSTRGPVWQFTTATPAPIPFAVIEQLKVLTWNIQHGTDLRGAEAVATQVAMLVDLNPDVIVLQEVVIEPNRDLRTAFEQRIEAATGQPWTAVWAPAPTAPTMNPEGVLILTRLPVLSSSIKQMDVVPTDPGWRGSKRAAAQVELAVNGRRLHLFTTHLDTNASNRDAQLALVLEWIQTFPAPRLIGGDFNMMPSEGAYATTTAQFSDAWHTLVETQQSWPGPDDGYTKNVRTIAPWVGQPGRIDYWFHEKIDPVATPTEISVIETQRSDHNAVLMWVRVK